MKKISSALFLIMFLMLLLVYGQKHINSQDGSTDIETLPEEELDALLLEKGIDPSIIKYIPVLEKQYLIDCEVEAVSLGEEIKSVWEGYDINRLHSDDFSMRVIFARIKKEKRGEPCPCYRIIVLYEWEKLPVWTGEDELFLKYDAKAWLPQDDSCRQVNYGRKGDSVEKVFLTTALQMAGPGVFLWGIDIRRGLGGVVRDGYVATTLESRKKLEESGRELEIQVCYTHNIMGVVGNNGAEPRKDIRARHFLMARAAHFEDDIGVIE